MASLATAVLLSLVVLFFAAKEASAYRAQSRPGDEPFPYSRTRIVVRSLISLFILAEIWLLTVVRWTLTPERPAWIGIYSMIVLGLALGMVILAALDWRESTRLWKSSQERLDRDLLSEVRPNRAPRDPH